MGLNVRDVSIVWSRWSSNAVHIVFPLLVSFLRANFQCLTRPALSPISSLKDAEQCLVRRVQTFEKSSQRCHPIILSLNVSVSLQIPLNFPDVCLMAKWLASKADRVSSECSSISRMASILNNWCGSQQRNAVTY